jgi:glycosyltransferase involved in cell wall biosynthesis
MREALGRMDEGLPETYRAQHYSVEYALSLTERADQVSVICVNAPNYQETAHGLSLYGLAYHGEDGWPPLRDALEKEKPTHVILRTPVLEVFGWAKNNGARVLPNFADSFIMPGWSPRAIKNRIFTRRLAHILNSDDIDVVTNHNVAACRDLVRIGVKADKILPWDWPSAQTPSDFEPKTLERKDRFRLIYVGMVCDEKGVGDLIDAYGSSAFLREETDLTIVGGGNDEPYRSKARQMGAADHVHFAGLVPNKDVFARMRDADLVLVPSRHDYSEGLPGTIYEALTVRTPIVMSDHPMFEAYFTEGNGIRFAPARAPAALARTIEETLADGAGYRALSEKTAAAFDAILCPTLWHEVIDHWLADDADGYLAKHKGEWARALETPQA